MTPCPSCNRHVRDEVCPFCGAKCVQAARVRLGRVARGTLFAASAVALADCASEPMYGAVCLPDACVITPLDATSAADAAVDASVDADAATDATSDATDAAID